MSNYIHGSESDEQIRLTKLNALINTRCLELLDVKEGEQILDIGSGLGQFSLAMAGRSGAAGRCVGIERDKNQLKVAQANLESTGYNHVEFRLGNAENLELGTEEWGTFDLAHTRFVLEHIGQPENVVQGMVKAIKPGGRVVLADDDHEHFCLYPEPPGFLSVWKAYLRSYDRLGNDPYIGRRLVTLLYNAGLRKIQNNVVFFGDCAGSDTFPAYVANLIGILVGARDFVIKEQLIDKQGFDDAVENLHVWSKRSYSALWYSINWAQGFKNT